MRLKFFWVIYAIAIIFLLIVQSSFLPQFVVFRTKPDFVLLFVISIGLMRGYREGAITGVIAGVLAGIISWNVWGFYVLGYGLAGFAAGHVTEKIALDPFAIPLSVSAAGSLAFSLLFALTGQFFELFYPGPADLLRTLVFALWNTLFALPVFYLVKRFIIPGGKTAFEEKISKKPGYLMD